MRVRDSLLNSVIQDILKKPQADRELTDQKLLDVLAAAGDEEFMTAEEARKELAKAGLTPDQKVEIAQPGADATERMDLRAVLDQSEFDVPSEAKDILAKMLKPEAVHIEGTQGGGKLTGVASPGDRIEVINASAAPESRLHIDDTVQIATADANGRFSAPLPKTAGQETREGDLIRLRARKANGEASDWVSVTATGIGADDDRAAAVRLDRVTLTAEANDQVSLGLNTSRPLSEPYSTVRLTNLTSKKTHDVQLTDLGEFPRNFTVPGKKGDQFQLAVSDGIHNTDFTQVTPGTLTVPGDDTGSGVDLADPAPTKDHQNADGSSKYRKVKHTGPLFIEGAEPADLRQGAIGNCYYPAGWGGVVAFYPEMAEKAVVKTGNDKYVGKFFQENWMGQFEPVTTPETDGDLYVRSWGGPIYGGSLGGSTDPDKMELWFPMAEKLFALWKGGAKNGYETIGQGGIAGEVMSQILGKPYDYVTINPAQKDALFKRIQEAARTKSPMAAGTFGEEQEAIYRNSGVYANHAYTVLGAEEIDGVKYVKLRNPWGESEPGSDGKDDGFFMLELDKFVKLYESFQVVKMGGARPAPVNMAANTPAGSAAGFAQVGGNQVWLTGSQQSLFGSSSALGRVVGAIGGVAGAVRGELQKWLGAHYSRDGQSTGGMSTQALLQASRDLDKLLASGLINRAPVIGAIAQFKAELLQRARAQKFAQ